MQSPRQPDALLIQNFEGYIPPELIEKFESESGIKVQSIPITDQDGSIVESGLLMRNSCYDVVLMGLVPHAKRIASLGLLAPIPAKYIEHVPYDLPPHLIKHKGEFFCLPYMLGTISVAYDPQKVEDALGFIPKNALDLVFDIATIKKLRDAGLAITVLDSPGEVFGELACYKKTQDTKKLAQHLLKARASYNKITIVTYVADMQRGRLADVVLGWSTFLEAGLKSGNGNMVIRSPGQLVWADVLCVPANAKNKKNAFRFIKFLSRPENMQIIQNSNPGHTTYKPTSVWNSISRAQERAIWKFWNWMKKSNKKNALKAAEDLKPTLLAQE